MPLLVPHAYTGYRRCIEIKIPSVCALIHDSRKWYLSHFSDSFQAKTLSVSKGWINVNWMPYITFTTHFPRPWENQCSFKSYLTYYYLAYIQSNNHQLCGYYSPDTCIGKGSQFPTSRRGKKEAWALITCVEE